MGLIQSTQGEDYIEVNSATDLSQERTEVTKSPDTYFGLSPTACVILGTILFIVLCFVIVTHSHAAGLIEWYSNGTLIGTSTDSAIGTSILDDAGNVVGTISDSGTAVTGSDMTTAFYIPSATSGGSLGLEEQQVITLKKLGYSGDEISLALSTGMDYDALVAEGEALRNQEAHDALVRMSDSASDEFKFLAEHSIYFMQRNDFPERVNDLKFHNKEGSYIVNADYEKLDTYGHQLTIKLKIANNDYAFMTVTPDRWNSLPDSGNIVVVVNFVVWGMDGVEQVYFTDISEVDMTHLTTNPEDSTFDLEQIINY